MQRPEKNAEMTHAVSYYLMPEAKRVLDPGIFTLYLLLFFNLPPSPFAIPFASFLTIQHRTSMQPSVACNCHQRDIKPVIIIIIINRSCGVQL